MKLDANAQKLLSFVQQQTKRIDRTTEKAISAAAEQSGGSLSGEKLQEVLVKAMPEHAQTIKQIGKKALSYKCDNTNGDFITQIVGTHSIEKEVAAVYSAPYVPPRVYRDPLVAKFIMAKNADVMLLFNAGMFDDQGRPLLMKVVAREKMKDKLPDISNYHTLSKEPDIEYVPNDAAYVTTKDVHEAEFAFGHPLAQVSLDAKGNELSRSGVVHPDNKRITTTYYGMSENGTTVPNLSQPVGWAPVVETGASLDDTPVQTFQDKIKLDMTAKGSFPKGGWLDTSVEHVDASLVVEPGYMLEPDSNATVTFAGSTVETKIEANDFSFVGSPSGEAKLEHTNVPGYTVHDLLNAQVQESTGTGGGSADQRTVQTSAAQLIFADWERTKIAGHALEPLKDLTLSKAQLAEAGIKVYLEPLKGDPKKDGQEVFLDLGKGFLSAEDGASVKGWKIVAGFQAGPSSEPEWQEGKMRTVGDQGGSAKESFRLKLDDAPEAIALGRNLEIRVFNERGVPAHRVLIPFTEIPWGAAAAECDTHAQS